ncbi:unnamed protein product [Rotaria sordida]|uniref:Helicase ATP-binding domain-containing protein n=1 Tax=Rotaria sordida TaxID=392033 RepID=A0A814V500_9BILA|nr:unnamed protein product [Rotaria sordida]CAF1482400.1 unnamed protein product [Rotaria sordida]
MKREEEENTREKRREELKAKIDLEEQYANAAKNILTVIISKKTKRDFDAKYQDLFNGIDNQTINLLKCSFYFGDEELIIKDDNRKILFDDTNSPTKVDSTGLRGKKAHVQFIFCTHIHSQISQFIGEIQKTKYVDQLRLVSTWISDVQDIEDVVKLARELNTCPYYATRAAIAVAHLVVLPYQILMHKSRREAYGIEMRNNVIIIDEAHNLPDAICAMHSNEINGNQVC